MRILQLHNRQRARGGADIQLEREADGLAARGHDVDAVIVETTAVEQAGPVRAGVAAFWNRDAVRDVRRAIDGFAPDVVHVHTPFPVMSPAVIRAAAARGVAVVATSQSWRYNCASGVLARDGQVCEECVGRHLKYPAVVHRCYQDRLLPSIAVAGSLSLHHSIGTFAHKVHRLTALTPFMRERIIAEGIAPHRVVVKPNSSPDPGPPLDTRAGTYLFAGRLVDVKGVHTLLDAWRRVPGDLRLVVAGDGPLRPLVDEAAATDPRIDARGWLDGAAVGELLRTSEALVLPSEWYEGLPVVLTEAFAAGTPIIASDVGNFTGLVTPGVDGVHFRVGDPAALADAVGRFDAEADRPAMRAAARATFERSYEAETVLDLLESIYADAIAEAAS
ncbi:MAG: glycosyltransferase family 4 protein [Acidimicrobiales bacterium]|nr:glycosyltransferase family 4 protein [Acidimicrobiales bacterium]